MQNIQLLKWCKEIGMKVYWNLLYGFPGEDPEDYQQMALLIDQLAHLDPPQGMGSIRLDRFSPNFESAADLGLCNVRPDRSYTMIYDVGDSDLTDLAYYFEHDYLDGRQPRAYAAEAEQAMRRWYDQAGGHGLVYIDHRGELAVWDFRAVARRRLTVLTGLDREVFLFCDSHRSARAVEVFVGGLGQPLQRAHEALRRLVDDGLALHLDDRYLALAVASTPLPESGDRHSLDEVLAF
jgi:hypothetical protein